MATIDVDELRDYLLDYYGTLDVADIERASGHELCRIAESMGVDLRKFTL